MNINKLKKLFLTRFLYYHVLYWIFNVLFFAIIFWSRSGFKGLLNILHENIAYLPVGLIFTYFSVNFLISRYFFNNKVGIYIALQIGVLLLYPVLSTAVKVIYIDPVVYNVNSLYNADRFLSMVLVLVFDIVPLAGVKILNQIRKDELLQRKTENDKMEAELKLKEAELKLLKGQIHPHFLFNTLNNIYSLSIEKSDKTPDLVIRLADMLSYIIYDCNSEKVPLVKEIDFIKSFIELQKIRYDYCDISVKVTGDLNNRKIVPLILHTFIDNSFKHGADKDSGKPWIKISISSENGLLFFSVINSTFGNVEATKQIPGIGIINARKRLELIYPDRHDLVIHNSESTFSVFLKIEL